jgi:Secretion system C-terminal sorting domain
MKTFLTTIFIAFATSFAVAQTTNITVNYGPGGFCDVCGTEDYVCNNENFNWNNGIASFTDPVPAGNVVTGIWATVYILDCGAPFTEIHINGTGLVSFETPGSCFCGTCAWALIGLPGPYDYYNYGGSNDFQIVVNSGVVCVDRVELQINYEPSCDISVSAGDNQTVYYGYAPAATANLVATVDGGDDPVSVTWYDDQYNIVGTGTSISVSPTASTTYIVEAIDANECVANDQVTVCVVDVRCGNNMDKVQLCHSDGGPQNTICVSPNAVPDHLGHGDLLGSCEEQPGPCEDIPVEGGQLVTLTGSRVADATAGVQTGLISHGSNGDGMNHFDAQKPTESGFKVLQNPFASSTEVAYMAYSTQQVVVSVYDTKGNMVAELYNNELEAGEPLNLEFDATTLPDGLYICHLQAGSHQEFKKLVKLSGIK